MEEWELSETLSRSSPTAIFFIHSSSMKYSYIFKESYKCYHSFTSPSPFHAFAFYDFSSFRYCSEQKKPKDDKATPFELGYCERSAQYEDPLPLSSFISMCFFSFLKCFWISDYDSHKKWTSHVFLENTALLKFSTRNSSIEERKFIQTIALVNWIMKHFLFCYA